MFPGNAGLLDKSLMNLKTQQQLLPHNVQLVSSQLVVPQIVNRASYRNCVKANHSGKRVKCPLVTIPKSQEVVYNNKI